VGHDVQRDDAETAGRSLTVTFFFAKPPIPVLEAVKNDSAFK
jgi:hypothetical protein